MSWADQLEAFALGFGCGALAVLVLVGLAGWLP
jgi:hypothetical protein